MKLRNKYFLIIVFLASLANTIAAQSDIAAGIIKSYCVAIME